MNLKFIIYTTVALFTLTNCAGDIKSTLGMRKQAPDEFMVISNPPLKEPPEFTLLAPGTLSGQLPLSDNFERGIMEAENIHNLTQSEKTFLDTLDNQTSSATKLMIDEEHNHIKSDRKSKGVVRKTFNRLGGNAQDPVIDPIAERARIKENVLKNKPINEGKVENKSRSTINQLFD